MSLFYILTAQLLARYLIGKQRKGFGFHREEFGQIYFCPTSIEINDRDLWKQRFMKTQRFMET